MQKDAFGRLLKGAINSIAAYEGKTAQFVEDELGQQIGVTAATIQRYKTGFLPPESRTVKILAEAGVQRAYLNRGWLEAFLHAAGYPERDALIEQFYPSGPGRPHLAPVKDNLPPPTYSQFVRRPYAFDEVVEGLRQRSAVVLIVSLGGMGKTSLAREVAAYCLGDAEDTPQFDVVVWVADKDRPGTTTLSIVLDEIARTLDYPSYTQLEHEEKRRAVELLLRRQRVLLVVDSFETITDGALLAWLLRLPEPSKALITSREYRREFRRGSWPVDLRGMSEAEAHQLIQQRLKLLRFTQLGSNTAQIAELVRVTGGNPKAIEMALGCIRHGRQPLQEVIEDLKAARGIDGLFDDLFARCWNLLDKDAQRVLICTPLFLQGMSSEALAATAGVTGLAFAQAAERLVDLALLDLQHTDLDGRSRYTLHPLVRAFARAQQCQDPDFEAEARRRWVEWYIGLVSDIGYCWDDLSKLELLDPEQETVYAVIEWALQHARSDAALAVAKGVSYYYYTRGFWNKQPPMNLVRAQAAHALGDAIGELEALAFHVQVLSKQGNTAEAEKFLAQLDQLARTPDIPDDIIFLYQHALALYWMARGDLEVAHAAWELCLNLKNPQIITTIAVRQWLGTCLYQKGRHAEAKALFLQSLHDSIANNHIPGLIAVQAKLAAIYLDEGDLGRAAEALAESSAKAYQYQDRGVIAEIQRLFARIYSTHDNIPAAHAALAEAIDLFERLGMRRELAEARKELEQLEWSEYSPRTPLPEPAPLAPIDAEITR